MDAAVEVTSDGAGLVSHAGVALLGQVADKVGLTSALSLGLAALKRRRRGHDPGVVIRDPAVMLTDGGECVSDLGATRDQDVLFGSVASESTAYLTVENVASAPGMLDAMHPQAALGVRLADGLRVLHPDRQGVQPAQRRTLTARRTGACEDAIWRADLPGPSCRRRSGRARTRPAGRYPVDAQLP